MSDLVLFPSWHRFDRPPALHPAAPTARRPATVVPAGSDRRPLRVLLVSEACGGGAGRHVLDLAEGLIDRGCDVHLISAPGRMDRAFQERLGAARALRNTTLALRRGPHPSDLARVREVRRYVREAGPFDVIHGHASKGGALARLAAFGTRVPAFYTMHGFILMDPGLGPAKRVLYHAIEWVLSKGTRRIIAVSPEEQRVGIGKGLGRSRLLLIPNGVDPMALPSRSTARAALGLPQTASVVGFIGRLVDQKAPDVLLRAFAGASRAVPEAVLAIVGSGPLEVPMRTLANALGIADRVAWLGERDGASALPAFDVFALSSRKEGLPYVLLEALAAGLPVVATRPAGVELLVEDGRNGFVVPPNEPEPFAAALVALLSDRRLLAEYGRASSAHAARFTAQAMVERTLSAYLDCLPETDRPARVPGPRPSRSNREHALNHPVFVPERGTRNMAAKPRSAELHPGPGFRVKTQVSRLDPRLIDEFRQFATPDISDLLNRLYAVNPAIHCLTGAEHTLCGPACTVKVFPGDNLMVHKALDVAKPGDIIVVDSSGSITNAVLGDLVSTKAKHRGIAGFIVDGLIRDLPGIMELDFPVFARGTTPVGPLHRGPGEINFAICCGGVVVNPGDLIVGDAAGVIVVPKEIAAELLERLKSHHAANEAYLESVKRGEFTNTWVDRLLEEQSCPILGGDQGGNGSHWLGTELAEALVDGSSNVIPQAQDLL